MADIEAIEKLFLQTYSHVFRASHGNRPLKAQVRVHIGLLRARSRPTEEIMLAVISNSWKDRISWRTGFSESETALQFIIQNASILFTALLFYIIVKSSI